MPSLLNALMGNTNQLNDQTIANDMLSSSKQAASTYLTAILESSTPELRTMYSNALTQIIAGHEGLTSLAINRDWYQPYKSPEQQLTDTFKQSQTLVNPERINPDQINPNEGNQPDQNNVEA